MKAALDVLGQKVGDLEESQSEVSNKIALLTDRVKALEDRVQGSPPRSPPRDRKSSPPQAAKSDKVRMAYLAAQRDFESRRFKEALQGFSGVLGMGPKHDLADNAQYWIGECYYGLNDYERAIQEFQKVFGYPDTEKNDDAQLKIGLCFLKLGDRGKALVELKRLTVDYPESEYVRRAESLLRGLEARKE